MGHVRTSRLVELREPKCHFTGCTKRATHKLLSAPGGELGIYCEPHGQYRLNSRLEIDAAQGLS